MAESFATSKGDRTKAASILERLENVDTELHLIIEQLTPRRSEMSLEDIRELLSSNVKSDIDPTILIRQMREKEYGL